MYIDKWSASYRLHTDNKSYNKMKFEFNILSFTLNCFVVFFNFPTCCRTRTVLSYTAGQFWWVSSVLQPSECPVWTANTCFNLNSRRWPCNSIVWLYICLSCWQLLLCSRSQSDNNCLNMIYTRWWKQKWVWNCMT